MTDPLFEGLHAEGLISEATMQRLRQKYDGRLVSVHRELKTLLYAGVLMISSGLGILIYQNIDSIGHQAVFVVISTVCAGSFAWAAGNKRPFTRAKGRSPGLVFDYVVLLGTLSILTLAAYPGSPAICFASG